MKLFEYWARIVVINIFIVLILQWSWNQIMPMFGIPEINILQSAAGCIMLVIPTMLLSIAWKASDKPVQHFHYTVENKSSDDKGLDN